MKLFAFPVLLALAASTLAANAQDWSAHLDLAKKLYGEGKYDQAQRSCVTAIQQLRAGPERRLYLANALTWLAATQEAQEDYLGSERAYKEALEIYQAELGPDHIAIADILGRLGVNYYYQRRYDLAASFDRSSAVMYEKLLGADNADVALSLHNLGVAEFLRGDAQAARLALERACEIRRKSLGMNHVATLASERELEIVRAKLRTNAVLAAGLIACAVVVACMLLAVLLCPVVRFALRHGRGDGLGGWPTLAAGASLRSPGGKIMLSEVPAGALGPPSRFSYIVGLSCALAAMGVLVVAYVAFVVAAGCGVYWYCTWITGKVSGIDAAVRCLPAIVFFLGVLAPVVTWRPRRELSRHVQFTEEREPEVYAFVRAICRVVGAPSPMQIRMEADCNASASFHWGIIGAMRKRLVLRIGVPVIAAMSRRQIAGVVAHEAGHFGQSAAMRLTYLLRTASAWFASLVYDRSLFRLAGWFVACGCSSWLIAPLAILLLAASLLICAAALVTWPVFRILLRLGLITSSGVLRQMEYNADSCAALVSGSEEYAAALSLLPTLEVAQTEVLAEWAERATRAGLSPDAPAFWVDCPDFVSKTVIGASELAASGHILDPGADAVTERLYGTHPPLEQRRLWVRQHDSPGVLFEDGPAAGLFRDFGWISKKASLFLRLEAAERWPSGKSG